MCTPIKGKVGLSARTHQTGGGTARTLAGSIQESLVAEDERGNGYAVPRITADQRFACISLGWLGCRLSRPGATASLTLFDADVGDYSVKRIREYFVPDFSNWKNHDAYQQSFEKLLKALKIIDSPGSPSLTWNTRPRLPCCR